MSNGTSARKVVDVIDAQSYEAGYTAGYSEAESKGYEEGYQACRLEFKQKIREQKQLKIRERRRRLYFLKQKVIGVFMLVLTIFAVKLLDGDATIALLTVPLGLILIFSKEKWWMDNYYFENEANERRKNQGHSGLSWGLMKSMVQSFSDVGEDFIKILD